MGKTEITKFALECGLSVSKTKKKENVQQLYHQSLKILYIHVHMYTTINITAQSTIIIAKRGIMFTLQTTELSVVIFIFGSGKLCET